MDRRLNPRHHFQRVELLVFSCEDGEKGVGSACARVGFGSSFGVVVTLEGFDGPLDGSW